MNYFLTMLAVLSVGTMILMTGNFLIINSEHNFQAALKDSFIWGIGFLLSFGTELIVIGTNL